MDFTTARFSGSVLPAFFSRTTDSSATSSATAWCFSPIHGSGSPATPIRAYGTREGESSKPSLTIVLYLPAMAASRSASVTSLFVERLLHQFGSGGSAAASEASSKGSDANFESSGHGLERGLRVPMQVHHVGHRTSVGHNDPAGVPFLFDHVAEYGMDRHRN